MLPDYKVNDAYETRVKDLLSAVNKEHLNERFLKKDDDLNYFDLKGTNIKNSELYYDGLYGDDDLVSKKHVDELNGKQDIAVNDKLSKEANKGSDRMDADLDINNKKIVNVGYTTWNQESITAFFIK